MVDTTRTLSREQRAAVVLMSLGEEVAAEILKHMEPKDLHRLGMAMVHLDGVDRSMVSDVLQQFNEQVENQTSMGIAGEEYIRGVLIRALGHDKAKQVMENILSGEAAFGMEALKWMDTAAIALALRNEHPQVVALVLSYLEAEQAGQVLARLPPELAYDATIRIATLEGVPAGALAELNELIETQVLSTISATTTAKVGGPRRAAELLNKLPADAEEAILGRIKEANPELGTSIEELMLDFEHLLQVDDRGVQTLLREIPSETLMVALRGADERVREKVMRNLSRRAAALLRDDMEMMAPVRVAEVEKAQKDIMGVAKRLADAGEINMSPDGGGDYL